MADPVCISQVIRWLDIAFSFTRSDQTGTAPNESDNGSLAHILATSAGRKLLGIITNQEKPDFDSRGPGEESQMPGMAFASRATSGRICSIAARLEARYSSSEILPIWEQPSLDWQSQSVFIKERKHDCASLSREREVHT